MANIPSSKLNGEEKKKEREEREDEESFSRAAQLVSSLVLPMALQSATELGVFEVLKEAGENAKLSAKDIASKISCTNPEATSMLDRILTLLSSHSILLSSLASDNLVPPTFHRLYTITPVAKFFARNSDGVSLGPLMALLQDKIFLHSWSELKDAIREGGIPFNRVYGTHAFEYPKLDSRFNKVFNTAMINHTTLVMKNVLESYKGFEGIKRLVDVGGGLGININLITSKYPYIHGINFDLPHVIQDAPSYPGVEHVGGDMFENVPKGDAIFMKWILHDWSDEQCVKLLKNCYDAIPDEGKVIVVEAILPKIAETNDAYKTVSQMDVLMMTQNPGGKERSEQEFMDLATAAGFSGIRYECHVNLFWVMEFFK
ncbi:caffeic acid 3-O-methyltransferase-like isoform X1 [Vigna unguiculata]|uniref:caffeic acid 3-O-methyltransferase-like isoform X1 n=1 Tax=Vigna unguiculata TaxID=3917 RepID=UPI001016271D|nr:caffeic acid 3-O-methyltransferase-like isoform X1 [Vigna unguiculata]